jgi:hypothetical protein
VDLAANGSVNCFYHPTTIAVGTCKSCNKGLCPACAVDLGKGLACKGHCEEDVKAVIQLIDRNIQRSPYHEKVLDTARRNRYFAAVFPLVTGALFLGFASYDCLQSGFEPVDFLTGGLGLSFLIIGLITLRNAARFPTPAK